MRTGSCTRVVQVTWLLSNDFAKMVAKCNDEYGRRMDVLASLEEGLHCNSFTSRGKRQTDENDRFKRAIAQRSSRNHCTVYIHSALCIVLICCIAMVTLHIEAWGTVMCLNMGTKACSPHCTYIHGPNVAHCSVPYLTAMSRRGGVSKTWHKSVCADRLWQSVCSNFVGGSAVWLYQMLFVSAYVSIIVICCNHSLPQLTVRDLCA